MWGESLGAVTDHPPASPAAVSLDLGATPVADPLEYLDDLDDLTLAALVRDKHKHEKIARWGSLIPSVVLIGWFVADVLGFRPGGDWVFIGTSLVASLSVIIAQRRHWRRECLAVGLSEMQCQALRIRLFTDTQKPSLLARFRASSEERVQWEVDAFAAGRQKQLAPSGDGRG